LDTFLDSSNIDFNKERITFERKRVHEKYSMLLKEEINKNPISEPAELFVSPTKSQ